jgi:hypothetical protein
MTSRSFSGSRSTSIGMARCWLLRSAATLPSITNPDHQQTSHFLGPLQWLVHPVAHDNGDVEHRKQDEQRHRSQPFDQFFKQFHRIEFHEQTTPRQSRGMAISE